MMDIRKLKENWEGLSAKDPLWSILSHPDKKGNKWNIVEFFENGAQEIRSVMAYIKSIGLHVGHWRALDFGCGVGRLTQSLCEHFDEVHGVDISENMIKLASEYNKYGDRCQYHLNERNNLHIFPDSHFDFIYSNITLQHIEPKYSKEYIREFIRILQPGGLLIFQVPDHIKIRGLSEFIISIAPKSLLDNTYRKLRYGSQARYEMHAIPKKDIIKLIESNAAKVLDTVKDHNAGEDWIGHRYCITK